MLSAIRISSVSSGIFLVLRICCLSVMIGVRIAGARRWILSSQFERYLRVFRSAAAGASINQDFFPVMIVESFSIKATTLCSSIFLFSSKSCVSFALAGITLGLSSILRLSFWRRRSAF